MAEPVKALARCSLVALALLGTLAKADTLNDPTRPSAVQAADGKPLSDAGPVLQMVTISGQHKSAMIDGQDIPLGGKYGDAVLVRIKDGEATLRKADGSLQTLHMYVGIEKKTVRTPQKAPTRNHQRRLDNRQ